MMKHGPLWVLACYLLWGVLPIFWKTLADVNSLYVLGCRIVWSLVFSAVVLALRRRGPAVRAVMADRKERRLLVLAGLFVCINWGVYIWAVNSSHGVDASLAYYMNPILAILLGTVIFRERLTKLQWLSVAVTFSGLVIAVIRYGQIPWMALIIGGSFAIYGAIKKKVHAEPDVSMFFESLVLTPFALVVMVVMDMRGTGAVGVLQGARWLLLPAAGVVTTVPLLLYAKGIRVTPLTLSGVMMYINPTMQLLIAVLLYHEEFTTTHAILFAFVWCGLALYLAASLLERRRKEHSQCV